MGVKGLWRLLLPIGRRVSIEVLEGKVLAIDASIWLTQFLKAMRDPDTGSVKPAAHLIGFFRRLAKLRFHGIRPILVFDGATPIIKLREINQRRQRREQFAPNSAGAVQRLAKRLLIQEIKKARLQKPASGGAFAPGFNLPEKEKQGTASDPIKAASDGDATFNDTSEEVARTLQAQEWQEKNNHTTQVPGESVPMESSEEIARALQEEEWQNQVAGEDSEDEDNDWDKAISDGESVDSKQSKSKGEIDFREEDGSALGNLSSMPSHARKDAIEAAKREQRMRSRKEFMPVAGQPEEYSQVQVRNFLRSTRLNQSIVKMAQELSDKTNKKGEAIASDPTRRIIFERFDENAKKDTNRNLIRRQDRDEESDSEIEWEGADESKSDTAQLSSRVGRGAPKEETRSESVQRTSRKETIILDSSDDEDLETHTTRCSLSISAAGQLGEETKSKARSTIRFCDDSSGTEVGMENDTSINLSDDSSSGGGFFEHSSPNRKEELGPQRDFSEVRTAGKEVASLGNEDFTENGKGDGNPKIDDKEGAESSEDEIDWEDGEVQVLEKPADRFETGETYMYMGDNSITDAPNLDTKNVAALEAAEKTAANLTDWAGRAFRRAVAQHEQENSTCQPSLSPPRKTSSNLQLAGTESKTAILLSNDSEEDDRKLLLTTAPAVGVIEEKLTVAADAIGVAERPPATATYTIGITDVSKHSDGEAVAEYANDESESNDNLLHSRLARTSIGEAVFQSGVDESNLLSQEEKLEAEQRRNDRDMEGINDEMKGEIIALIRLFGIPYVESPAEAEAQCVALEELGLVDGIVTEDSDVFVFGGKTIYRNMFDDQKFVEVYRAEDAEREMLLGGNEMVALAMLLGGDYTEGVRGVGIVNAMEILRAFPMTPGVKEGLTEYRKWLDGFDPSDAKGSSSVEAEGLSGLQKFHASHRSARSRWICPKHFPAENVLNAYLNPVVDRSSDRFSWGVPDVDKLVGFCVRNMGWEASDARRMLDPVMKRLESGMKQTRLDLFMSYSDNIQFANVRSKRLRSVFGDIQREQPKETDDSNASRSAKKSRNSC